MKKRIITMLLAVLALASSGVVKMQSATAAEPVTVYVNDRKITFPDAPAYIDDNNRTQIPMRFISEALGAKVDWDGPGQRATFKLDVDGGVARADFYIGDSVYYVIQPPGFKQERLMMDTVAVAENGRTYVPVRYVAEALGATVEWNSETKTVYITSVSPQKEQESEPGGEPKYDNQGMMLAKYANECYQKWLDTLRITYKGEKVYLSYTIPDNLPEGTELRVWLSCDVDHRKRDDHPFGWWYQTHEMRAGDREAGKDYLLPIPESGDVIKEMSYLPIEDIWYLSMGCDLGNTPGGIPMSSKVSHRYAQSSLMVVINTLNLKESKLCFSAFDKQGAYLPKELWVETAFDGTSIVKYE